VTVPAPVGDIETVKLYKGKKVAVTVAVAAFIVTVQVPVPEHPSPDQPEKVYPLAAEAVKVTDVSEV
jgi:hypothetical protein